MRRKSMRRGKYLFSNNWNRTGNNLDVSLFQLRRNISNNPPVRKICSQSTEMWQEARRIVTLVALPQIEEMDAGEEG